MGRDWAGGAREVLRGLESVSDIFLRAVESNTYEPYEPVAGYTFGGNGPK
jgi:hypothetical protein